jgi:hypothetical protein
MEPTMRSLSDPLAWKKCLAAAIAVAALVSGMAGRSRADLIYFTDRSSFDTANPGTTLEDFENATTANATTAVVSGPLDRFSDNDSFKPGDIIPNLRITSVGQSPGEFYVNNGVYVPTLGLTTNYQDNLARLDFFEGAINAFGIDLFGQGQGTRAYTISIFGAAGLIDTQIVTPDAFFGFSSTEGVTRVELDTNDFESFDNIAIGVQSVPEPASLAMLSAGGLGLLACRRLRRKRDDA